MLHPFYTDRSSNRRPEKYGGPYALELGQQRFNSRQNAPFLHKDISVNNDRSKEMMYFYYKDSNLNETNQQMKSQNKQSKVFQQNSLNVLEPNSIYDNRLKSYVNYNDRQTAQIFAADNIIQNSNYNKKEIEILKQSLKFCKEEQQICSQELKNTNLKISKYNLELQNEMLPQFKNLQQIIRNQIQEEKDQKYIIQRQIDELMHENNQFSEKTEICVNQIKNLEKNIGVQLVQEIQEGNSMYN